MFASDHLIVSHICKDGKRHQLYEVEVAAKEYPPDADDPTPADEQEVDPSSVVLNELSCSDCGAKVYVEEFC
jgi:hypothetical protein